MMGGWLLRGLLMVLFWGAVIALIVWAVRAFTRTQSVQSRTGVDYEPARERSHAADRAGALRAERSRGNSMTRSARL